MRIDTMRSIDFWAGVPLTFIASLAHRLWPWHRKAGTIKKILFIELSEMGSAILVDPAMRRVRTLYPAAELYFIIFEKNRASLNIIGTIDPVHTLTIKADSLLALTMGTLKALWHINRLRIDLVYDLELFSRFTSLLCLLSGAPLRVGFDRFHTEGLYRGNHLTHKVAYNPHMHISKNFLSLAHAPAEPEGTRPHTKIIFTDADAQLAQIHPDPHKTALFKQQLVKHHPVLGQVAGWFILNPNASDMIALRRWPQSHFTALSRKLLAAHPDMALIITGAPGERDSAQNLADAVGDPRLVNLAGQTRFDELPLLYTLAQGMLTNDSGPGHFSAPFGLKTFVMFGPETPALYGPLNPRAHVFYKKLACSPCVSAANHRKSACRDNICMQQITVNEVFVAIDTYLKEGKTHARTAG